MTREILEPLVGAFLPIAALTYIIAFYSFKNGFIRINDEKKNKWDLVGAKPNKTAKKTAKSKEKNKEKRKDRPTNNYLHKKWVNFGGGFYGLMALMTFFAIEIQEIATFILSIEGFQTITNLLNLSSLINLFVASIMNFVTAMIWFTYWPDQIDMGNGWIWLAMAYAGYHFGRWLAETHLDGTN